MILMWKGCPAQLETGPGCEETQKESIRSGPESVVANGAVLAREKETKLTPFGDYNCDVNGYVLPSDILSRIITDEAAQRGGPMVPVSLTNRKNPRSYAGF
ncbi:hypothetical protein TNCV_4221241 [Trichonephila clavipes]|nr:hypothetical protein TNCV_4221241 [Trichonephila clavipes]